MAEEANENEEEQKGSGLKKIIIFAVLGLLLVGAGIGGALFFTGSKDDAMAMEGDEEMMMEEGEMEGEMMEKQAIYHDLHPAFVANFTGNSKKKYMQVYVVAMAEEQEVIDKLEMHMPVIRNNILMTLSRKTSDEISTVEGKEELRQEVLDVVQNTMVDITGDEGVKDLFFTKFVAQ